MTQTIQMTNEQQLRKLIESGRAAATNTVRIGDASMSDSNSSFSNCTYRFGGSRNHEQVEEFITNIVTFKELEGISDEKALKGLTLLLYGIASTWWQGVRKEAKCWNDAIALLREHFSPTKSSYQIYMEFFEKNQEKSQLTDDTINEETQLDFLNGLLNIKYREYILSQNIHTFCDLLEQGSIIEHNNQAEADGQPAPKRPFLGRGEDRRRGQGWGRSHGRGRGFSLQINSEENVPVAAAGQTSIVNENNI